MMQTLFQLCWWSAIVWVGMLMGVGCSEDQKQQLKKLSIYGVRWFLGEQYRFQEPIQVKERKEEATRASLVLFFNSEQKCSQCSYSVIVNSLNYACEDVEVVVNITEKHHNQFNQFASQKGDIFTTYVHKCRILFKDQQFLQNHSIIPYKIQANTPNANIPVFSSALRSPSFQIKLISVAVLGDWGILSSFSKQSLVSKPITECLSKQIEINPDLRLLMLLGDLAYDLEGKSYINFLKYLQPFSEKMAILYSPGNHETINHKDIYQLVKQSFYSPSWSAFYGYFDIVSLGNYVFIGYNTESLFPGLIAKSNSSLFQIELEEQYGNITNLFSMQFPPSTRAKLQERLVMGYSHYPTYCSQEDSHESCINYRNTHEPYLKLLQEVGMNMFFSGHLHIYERSKQICNGGLLIRTGKVDEEHYEYNSEDNCSIFVIEGATGNNYYVETERHFELQPHSEKFVENTGFGMLSLDLQGETTHFKHIFAQNCQVVDDVILNHPQTLKADDQNLTGINNFLLQYGIIFAAAALIITYFWLRIAKKRRASIARGQSQKLSTKSHANVLQLAENESLN